MCSPLLCAAALIRNVCVMTRLFNFQAGRRSVLVTMVVQPFKFIVHSRDSRRVISFLLMLAGDVETNPGPLGVHDVDDTTILGSTMCLPDKVEVQKAAEVFRKQRDALTRLIQHSLSDVANKLHTKSIIPPASLERVMNQNHLASDRTIVLLNAVEDKIKTESWVFPEFIKILKSDSSREVLASELVKSYLNGQAKQPVDTGSMPPATGCSYDVKSIIPLGKRMHHEDSSDLPESKRQISLSDGNGHVATDGAEFVKEEASGVEDPLLSLEAGEDEYLKNKPQSYPTGDTEKCEELEKFASAVKLILLTINDHEYHAAAIYMKKPSDAFERAVFVQGYGTKVVGMFAKIKTALIQSDVGANSDKFIQHAIDAFPDARFVIAVGVCYAFDRSTHRLGDVLVSRQICDLLNSKFKGGKIINRGQTVNVVEELTKFCMNRTFKFQVTDKRHCKVYSGKMASLPFLIDEEAMQEAIKACVSEAIGGEMEGGQLLKFHPKKGVIIIKGVVDYGDGEKSKEFQFISAKAAVHYTHFKLEQAPL